MKQLSFASKPLVRYLSLALLVLVSCRGCERRDGPESLVAIVSPQAPGVLHVPSVRALLQKTDGFVTRATRKAGAALVDRLVGSIAAQLGFDPTNPDELEKVGIDPNGDLVLFVEDRRFPMVALRVGNAQALNTALTKLFAQTEGATKTSEEKDGPYTVYTVGRPFGTEVIPTAHWATARGVLLVAGSEGKDALKTVLQRVASAGQSEGAPAHLGQTPSYQELLEKTPGGQARFFARGPQDNTRAVMTAVDIGPEGLTIRSFAELDTKDAALVTEPVLPLAQRVEGDAVVAILSRAAQPQSLAALRASPSVANLLDTSLAAATKSIGLDAEKDVVPLLAGPFTLSVHLNQPERLGAQLPKLRTLNQALEFVHATVTAELKDPSAMRAALERSREALSAGKIQIQRRTAMFGDAEAVIYEPNYPAPKFGWAQWKNLYVYGAGAGRLERTLRFLSEGNQANSLAPALAGSVAADMAAEPNQSVIAVRPQLVGNLALSLPTGADGGLGLGALVQTGVQLLETLGDVAIGVRPEPEGLAVTIKERLQ